MFRSAAARISHVARSSMLETSARVPAGGWQRGTRWKEINGGKLGLGDWTAASHGSPAPYYGSRCPYYRRLLEINKNLFGNKYPGTAE